MYAEMVRDLVEGVRCAASELNDVDGSPDRLRHTHLQRIRRRPAAGLTEDLDIPSGWLTLVVLPHVPARGGKPKLGAVSLSQPSAFSAHRTPKPSGLGSARSGRGCPRGRVSGRLRLT